MEKKVSKTISLHQIYKKGLIPWIQSLPTLKKWIERDIKGNNILKTVVVITKKSKRYYFLERNINLYVQKFYETIHKKGF
mgnify:CR=1 FL=1